MRRSGPSCRRSGGSCTACIVVLAALLVAPVAPRAAHAAEPPIQLDPFAQATHGDPGCPDVGPPLLDAAQARVEAHVRVERGLRCAMDGTCAPGGAYKDDPRLNAAVASAVAADARFTDTSLWVTTTRRWVTVQGCVRTPVQHRELLALVRRQPGVERVFDEVQERARAPRTERRRPREPTPRERL